MTRKDFVALAKILREHNSQIRNATHVYECAESFDELMVSIQAYCKARNSLFNGDRFTRAVYLNSED